jgi:hypothetical protein
MLTVLTVFSALVLLRTLHPAGHENPPPDMDMGDQTVGAIANAICSTGFAV